MGHTGLSHDRGPDEQLVVGRSSGLCGWAHLASCLRSPSCSITNRTAAGFESCRARRYFPFKFDISRSSRLGRERGFSSRRSPNMNTPAPFAASSDISSFEIYVTAAGGLVIGLYSGTYAPKESKS